ncbi:MAG: hypothetical protein AAGG48_10650 [Planctomycetota bacterium]
MVAQNGLTQNRRRMVDLKFVSSEAAVRKQYRERVVLEQERRRLAAVCQIDNEALIDRLMEAGFIDDTIAALSLGPVAAAAWGSGYVTQEEAVAATQAIFTYDAAVSGPAEVLFRSWIVNRPSNELMSLWEEFTCERIQSMSDRERETRGQHLYNLTQQVALASGGFAGVGQICLAERRILDAVKRVFIIE